MKYEIILEIVESDFEIEKFHKKFKGFLIKTNKQEIKLGINSYQHCCEDWGYLLSEDNINDFIGATLFDVKIVDNALNQKKLENEFYKDHSLYNCMFVNLETSNGLLQFVAYNGHNGSYGHEAVLISLQKNDSDLL